MNIMRRTIRSHKFLYLLFLYSRFLLPAKRCKIFTSSNSDMHGIGQIYVINLDREIARWKDIVRELRHIKNATGSRLIKMTTRFSAIDARKMARKETEKNITSYYTLTDQLFVEPQPHISPDAVELEHPIQMSPAEIAVASSHIHLWQRIADGPHKYALILEDDIYFTNNFCKQLEKAWEEINSRSKTDSLFDIFYLSYREVANGAHKTFLSPSVFRPVRGLWFLSGYVLSKTGAQKLLRLLPCRGPVDLWLNLQFKKIDVKAIETSVINQRNDLISSNLYSILYPLEKLGAINHKSITPFPEIPKIDPVFAFGSKDSGLTSLAMALSMLGYRCYSNIEQLPEQEMACLLEGSADRTFNAYVNVSCLDKHIDSLIKKYPHAKFIITSKDIKIPNVAETNVINIYPDEKNKWEILCEALSCATPQATYPQMQDIRPQKMAAHPSESAINIAQDSRFDKSPWVANNRIMQDIYLTSRESPNEAIENHVRFSDTFYQIDNQRWFLRKDTFSDNLALFRPENVSLHSESGIILKVLRESLHVRHFSAGAISSQQQFLYGRFEIKMRASNTPGVVSGFFLHRNYPRQEIDIEITGNNTQNMLANVFYNPGSVGDNFEYGYRGTPAYIPLGFDAAADFHSYAIEWNANEIRWYADDRLIYRRGIWDPTPLPHLPMVLHVNIWPAQSHELAGHLAIEQLPTTTIVKSVAVDAQTSETESRIIEVIH